VLLLVLLWRCSNLLLLSLLRRLGLSSGFQVSGSGFRDWNSRCRVHGLRFRACLLLLLLRRCSKLLLLLAGFRVEV